MAKKSKKKNPVVIGPVEESKKAKKDHKYVTATDLCMPTIGLLGVSKYAAFVGVVARGLGVLGKMFVFPDKTKKKKKK